MGNLIAWYKLNGNGMDSSGFGNHATLSNITWEDGKIGTAASFNGTNSYLTLPSSIIDINTDFTMSFLIYPRTLQNFCLYCSRTKLGSGLSLFVLDKKIRYDLGDQWTIANIYIPQNEWSHIVIVKEGDTKSVYFNGEFIDSKTIGTAEDFNPSLASIGASQINGSSYDNKLNGLINDIRIYDYALSKSEIKELSQFKLLHYTFNNPDERSAKNLWSGINGRPIALYSGGTTPPTIELVDMKTPFGSQAYKVTIPANNDTQYNGCRATTNSATVYYDGRFYSYYAYVYGDTDDIHIYPTGSRGFAYCERNENKDISGWKCYEKIGHSDNYGGSGSLYMTYFAKNTSDRERVFYVAATQLEERDSPSTYTDGEREGLIIDSSGYEYHGEIVGYNSDIVDDAIKGIYSYYSKGKTDTYIINTDFPKLYDSFTYSCWVYQKNRKSKSGSNENNIMQFVMSYGRDVAPYGANIVIYDGEIRCFYGGQVILRSGVYADDGWHHVVFVFDKNVGGKLYVDGQLKASSTVKEIDYSNAHDALVIGKMSYGYYLTTSYFAYDGLVDDVRIYGTALSDKDIKNLYETKAQLDTKGNLYVNSISLKGSRNIGYSKPFGNYHSYNWGIEIQAKKKIRINSCVINADFTGPLTMELYDLDDLSKPNQIRTVYINTKNQDIMIPVHFILEKNKNYLWVRQDYENTPLKRTDDGYVLISNDDIVIPRSREYSNGSSTGSSYRYYYWFDIDYDVLEENDSFIDPEGVLTMEIDEVGITDGLIAWWPLNGDTYDYSGNGFDGENNGAIISNGLNQSCYYFDGDDDWIDVSHNGIFAESYTYTNGSTFSIWIYPYVYNNSFARYMCGFHYLTINSSGKLQNMVRKGDVNYWLYGNNIIPLNTWSHVICIVEKGVGVRYYVNGELDSAYYHEDIYILKYSNNSGIGASYEKFFHGKIQDVRIYNRVLTDEEIKILYNMKQVPMQIHNNTIYLSGELKME